ncbi:MAG TPA: hydrogenase nickel incorporation protein HypB, partial [Candidatus Cybelea sp.]|nr:hydrogenase nickel incorporation protein HypB [Candidatus Cybelea sp.]
TLVVNLLSSPGSGKTTLLVHTLFHFAPRYRTAALAGDQATDNDAQRLARSGVPVQQITTAAECRLDADMITKALAAWPDDELDLLFIENVGNLICPAEYDLGEDLRVVLFSVTEGEDKPLKYPLAFKTAHAVLLTKCDIAEAVEFDRTEATWSIRSVNPDAPIIELSARTGEGLDQWFAFLEECVAEKRQLDHAEYLATITQ